MKWAIGNTQQRRRKPVASVSGLCVAGLLLGASMARAAAAKAPEGPQRVSGVHGTAPSIWSDLRQRPLYLPVVGPGARCPAERADGGGSFGFGLIHPSGLSADGTLTFSGAGADNGWHSAEVPWTNVGAAEPYLVRGGRIDGAGDIRFGVGPHPQSELHLPKGSGTSYVRVRSGGCYAFQVDGQATAQVAVFRAAIVPAAGAKAAAAGRSVKRPTVNLRVGRAMATQETRCSVAGSYRLLIDLVAALDRHDIPRVLALLAKPGRYGKPSWQWFEVTGLYGDGAGRAHIINGNRTELRRYLRHVFIGDPSYAIASGSVVILTPGERSVPANIVKSVAELNVWISSRFLDAGAGADRTTGKLVASCDKRVGNWRLDSVGFGPPH